MGKKGKQSSQSQSQSQSSPDDLLATLGDFTSKENWEQFFTIRGADDAFEWYGEWPQLSQLLLSLFPAASSSPEILVPACGNSRLSEHLYDAGFKSITNVDFSKVAISDMLKRNVRERPGMKWRVMDITSMRFADETFDAVLDKGGLDALMEPKKGTILGNQYLSEVRRVLKPGGKFMCLTLAESHVLGLLFPKFRFGWKMAVHSIPQKPSEKPSFITFLLVAEKEDTSAGLSPITSSVRKSLDCSGSQAAGLFEALESENRIRQDYLSGSDILYSLEDLQLGAKGDIMKLSEGRRCQVTLGAEGNSRFSYKAFLLDAKENAGPFSYHCGVFIVPKNRAHEWLFSSEEGQWLVVDSSKAARLIMVMLDSSHSSASMGDIQNDLSPLVRPLAPGGGNDGGQQIPFMMAGDGIKQRSTVHQVTSPLTGPVVVEDVVYENIGGDVGNLFPSGDLVFRRLVFQRTENLVQSEALLIRNGAQNGDQEQRRKSNLPSKSKKKLELKQKDESSNLPQVCHDYMASSYHLGIISGFVLIAPHLRNMASAGKKVNVVVIGLGAGLLPLFLHRSMPFLHCEVVELDPVILNLASEFFGFSEDEDLQVHIADGIKFIREVKNPMVASAVDNGSTNSSSNGSLPSDAEDRGRPSYRPRIDILVVDVDSGDSSTGMTCPAAEFVEESFLLTVKNALSEQGLFVVNLVSRSSAIKDMVVSRMKTVFSHLYSLQLEEDVNMILFGLSSEESISEESFPESAERLKKLLKLRHPEVTQSIVDGTSRIVCLK